MKLTLWFLSLGKGWFFGSMDFNKFSECHLELSNELIQYNNFKSIKISQFLRNEFLFTSQFFTLKFKKSDAIRLVQTCLDLIGTALALVL